MRHPSGTSRTSRTPEGPGETLSSWGSHPFLCQNCETNCRSQNGAHPRQAWMAVSPGPLLPPRVAGPVLRDDAWRRVPASFQNQSTGEPCGSQAANAASWTLASCPATAGQQPVPLRGTSSLWREAVGIGGFLLGPGTRSCFLDCMTLRYLSTGTGNRPQDIWRRGQTFLSFIFNK